MTVVSKEEYTYWCGKGPIKQTGVRWTFKCDNPQCGKVFNRPDTRQRADRSHHYCCHPCSTNHVFGVCVIEDCEEPIKTQLHKRGKYADLCRKHKKSAQRKARSRRDRAKMFELLGNKCVCCGESDPVYFQIDHINNDADYSGPNSNKAGSIQLRHYLAEPDRYQLLCANCNYAKRMNSGELYCPEKFTRRSNQTERKVAA